jgi:Flp pilus assembly protein TadD
MVKMEKKQFHPPCTFPYSVEALPDDPTAWVSLADAFEKQGELEKSVSAYQQALSMGEDANIHVYIGIVYVMQGDPDQAAAQFQKAVEVDPLNTLAYSALGEVAMQKGDLEGAAQAYSRSLELEESALLHSQLASIYTHLGKPDDAILQAEKALLGEPHNLQFINQLAGLYAQVRRLEEAEAQYRALLELDSNRPDAHTALAGIAYKRCDLETMLEEYENVATLGQEVVYYQALYQSL